MTWRREAEDGRAAWEVSERGGEGEHEPGWQRKGWLGEEGAWACSGHLLVSGLLYALGRLGQQECEMELLITVLGWRFKKGCEIIN